MVVSGSTTYFYHFIKKKEYIYIFIYFQILSFTRLLDFNRFCQFILLKLKIEKLIFVASLFTLIMTAYPHP